MLNQWIIFKTKNPTQFDFVLWFSDPLRHTYLPVQMYLLLQRNVI